MPGILRTLYDCATLWIYIEAAWCILINILYYLSIPWIVWSSCIIICLMWFIKNPPPDIKIAQQVLGVDPLELQKNELNGDNQGKQFCMKVIAHRGGGYDYPENSLAAFSNSKKRGCNCVEFDLTRTKDNIPVIFHDDTIERLTGKSGVIKDMSWDELKKLDISCNHPLREKFEGIETIALFSETIEQCLNLDLHLIIDIKDTSLEIIQVLLDAYKKHPELYQKAAITSFNPIIIYMIRRREPRIITCLSYRPRYFSTQSYSGLNGHGPARLKNPFKQLLASTIDILHDWCLPKFSYYVLGITAILMHKDTISSQVINEWNNRGIRIMAWSVNLPSEKMHFTKTLKITYLTDTLIAENIT